MKEFIVTIEITNARVTQTYVVQANSESDAVLRVEQGCGDLRSTEVHEYDQMHLFAVEAV